MTLYRVRLAPDLGTFLSATEAVLAALAAGVPAEWEAVK